MPISDIVATVAQLRCLRSGSDVGSGSGFFYEHGGNLFLVTNRHVLVDEDDNYYPDKIKLQLHTTPTDIRQNAELQLSLYHGTTPRWKEHAAGAAVDVVALPIDNRAEVEGRFFIRTFGSDNHIPQDVDIAIGEDVQVIGYPLGFHDEVHNLPIVRNATIASVYPIPFRGHPFVLIDARLHSGTSGSPVLTKPTNTIRKTNGSMAILTGTVTYLMGVHSASLDISNRDAGRDEPLGLNIAWFASLIPEIISGTA